METMDRDRVWTDERLDDLADRVGRGFDRIDTDICGLRSEVSEGFKAVDSRFDALQRTLIVGFVGIVAGVVGAAVAAIIAAHS